MKQIVKLFTLLAILSLVSCDELIDIKFTTNPHEVLLVIQPSNSGDIFESFENISSDIKKEVEENGGSLSEIDEIIINSIKVSLVSGAENLDAINNLDILIKIEGADTLKLAWTNDIPLSANEFTPEAVTSNLKNYISEENYSIISKGLLRDDVESELTLKLEIDYQVTI